MLGPRGVISRKGTLAGGSLIRSLLYKSGGPTCEIMQESFLQIYGSSAVSKCIYANYLLSLNGLQRGKLEHPHRAALYACLGALKYARSATTLVNPRIRPYVCKPKRESLGTLNAFTKLHWIRKCFDVTWTNFTYGWENWLSNFMNR